MKEAMGMMPCEHVLDRLWEYLDDELTPGDEEKVRKHLEIFNRCYPQYDFRRAYFEYTRRIQQRDHAPPELRRRLFQRLLEQESGNGDGRP
jgi:anti-sigma factor (TIGR02949 family)